MKELKIGISGLGAIHTDAEVPTTDEKFRLIKESGVFDYIDRTPPRADLDAHLKASARYGIPTLAGGFYYMVGRDEELLSDNLRIGKECGSEVHNVQIFTKDAAGRQLSNEDIAEVYLRTAELGDKIGVRPCFENHINMWSEHPGRVALVADLVKKRGAEFYMTMDHSHVVFKMDNDCELEVQNLGEDVRNGKVVLDPAQTGNVAREWIDDNFVVIAHARPAVPANPVNIWAKHPNGSYGRGVQYPWIKPGPAEWHSEWDEKKLDPWKRTVVDLLRHHATRDDSRLVCLTLEMIPPVDYGAGAKYSIFENNVACAAWIREMWNTERARVS